MKFILERHAYAPELNKIHFLKGGKMNTPHCVSIKEVREKYFKKKGGVLSCVVYSSYFGDFSHLSRCVASGVTKSRKEALNFSRQYKQNGGKLIDGRTLPPNKLTFQFFY